MTTHGMLYRTYACHRKILTRLLGIAGLLVAGLLCSGCEEDDNPTNVGITVENRASSTVQVKYTRYDELAEKSAVESTDVAPGAYGYIDVQTAGEEMVLYLTCVKDDASHTYTVLIQNAYVLVADGDFED